MRRKKAIRRGRWASVFVAAVVGYLLGSWNAAAVRSSQASNAPTAAQTVALRFPSDFKETPLQATAAAQAPAPSYQLASASTVVTAQRGPRAVRAGTHGSGQAGDGPAGRSAGRRRPGGRAGPDPTGRDRPGSGASRRPFAHAAVGAEPRRCRPDFAEAARTRRHGQAASCPGTSPGCPSGPHV